jgi:hypothetical protein
MNALARPAPRPRRLLVPVATGAVLAFAAGAALAIFLPQETVEPPAPHTIALTSEVQATTATPVPGIVLTYEGKGEVTTWEGKPHVEWRLGRLDVEVEPDKGLDLTVSTREGEVRVVGTGFRVERSPLGTDVSVRHGRVEVRCDGAAARFLGAGESASCLPTSPAGLLGRARQLYEVHAPASDVLSAIDRGMQTAEGSIETELRVLRIRTLLDDGRKDEALADAEAFLAGTTELRRTDVLRMAIEADPRCKRARPFLEALAERAPTAADLDAFHKCLPKSDPRRRAMK